MSGPRYDLVPHVGGKPPPVQPEAPVDDGYIPDRRFFRNSPFLCFAAAIVLTMILLSQLSKLALPFYLQ